MPVLTAGNGSRGGLQKAGGFTEGARPHKRVSDWGSERMQWLSRWRGSEDQQSFIVGSDRWMGSSSANKNSDKSADDPSISSLSEPLNPIDQHAAASISDDHSVIPYTPDTGLHPDSGGIHCELSSLTIPSESKLYPKIQLSSLTIPAESKIYPKLHHDENLSEEQGGKNGPHASSEKSGAGLYPEIFSGAADLEDSEGGNGRGELADVGSLEQKLEQEDVVVASEEVLVKLPDTMVHLIDEQGSALLASGEFSLLKLVQNGDGIAIFAKVGDEFRWPIAKDVSTAKLDPAHYCFTLRAADEEEGNNSTEGAETTSSKGKSNKTDASVEVLSYGVTFTVQGNEEALKDLDKLLDQYSLFSAPTVLLGDSKDSEKVLTEAEKTGKAVPPAGSAKIRGKIVPTELMQGKDKPSDEVTTAFWTTMAPNVEDYNSYLAKAIAAGTGHIIKGIFWCSDSTIANLQKGGTFVKGRIKPGTKQVQFSARTMKNIHRAKKISKMSQKTAEAVLSGVVRTVGLFSSSLLKSKAGQKFFRLMPGEVALVSLDAFGKLFDAVEMAGKNVLSATSVVTSGVVSHRYGEQAAELTHDGLASVGYTAGTIWTIYKIRKVLNPEKGLSKRILMKTAAKTAFEQIKK